MLFNPDDGLSIEEIIQRKWDTEWDMEFKAELLQLTEAMDCTWREVVAECLGIYVDTWKDPAGRKQIEALRERREFPYGKDPSLR